MTKKQQISNTIMMVRPAHFGYDEETAANNAFQTNDTSLSKATISAKAREEFDLFVKGLREAGVQVVVMDDTKAPRKPDAVFPNNWITTHEDGTVITYPMFAPNRRQERQPHILESLREQFHVHKIIELEQHESAEVFLEGTGSMIMDRPNNLVYACFSPRTHPQLLSHFCKLVGCKEVCFSAVDAEGQDIYHTNVMMAVGETFVVICLDTVRDPQERQMLLDQFDATGKDVVEISIAQMMAFAGNMLQVRSSDGQPLLVMSTQAYESLDLAQIQQLKKHTQLFHSPIHTIETYGGGSARCMMAEIFLAGKEATPEEE
ncbi:MAG: arginine deiminase-related protein [Bacteroidota bacterium]